MAACCWRSPRRSSASGRMDDASAVRARPSPICPHPAGSGRGAHARSGASFDCSKSPASARSEKRLRSRWRTILASRRSLCSTNRWPRGWQWGRTARFRWRCGRSSWLKALTGARTRAAARSDLAPSWRSRGTRERPAWRDALETGGSGWTRPTSRGVVERLPFAMSADTSSATGVAANLHRDLRRSGASRCKRLDGGRGGRIASIAIRRGRLQEALYAAVRAAEFSDLTPAVRPYAKICAPRSALARSPHRGEERLPGGRGGPPAERSRRLIAHVRGLRLLWEGDERIRRVAEAARVSHSAGTATPTTSTGVGTRCAYPVAGRGADAVRLVERLDGARRPTLRGRVSPPRSGERASPSALAMMMPPRPGSGRRRGSLTASTSRSSGSRGPARRRRLPARQCAGGLPRAVREAVDLADVSCARCLVRRLPASCGSPEVAPNRSADRDRLTPRSARRRDAAAGTRTEIARRLHLSDKESRPPEARLGEARDRYGASSRDATWARTTLDPLSNHGEAGSLAIARRGTFGRGRQRHYSSQRGEGGVLLQLEPRAG